jgi:hypothetical protein
MVDALKEARRILVDRGILVDARPDSSVTARVRNGSARGAIIGTIGTQRPTKMDDRLADRAIAEVRRLGLFSSKRRGRLWHAIPFEDLRELQDYLDDHLRFSRRVRWRVPRARRAGPVFVERAVRFEVLERR